MGEAEVEALSFVNAVEFLERRVEAVKIVPPNKRLRRVIEEFMLRILPATAGARPESIHAQTVGRARSFYFVDYSEVLLISFRSLFKQ